MTQRSRELGWGFPTPHERSALDTYNSLEDINMRHFFEDEHRQKLLYRTGQINRAGQLIDLERNKRKIIILQKEFQKAEAAQLRKRKEEDDIREKVRKERFTLIEEIKRDELRRRIRDDRSIRREIVRIGLQAQGTLTSRIIRQPRSRNGQMSSLSEKKPTFAFAKADNVSMRTGKGDGSTLAKVSRESLSGDARKKRDLCEESCG